MTAVDPTAVLVVNPGADLFGSDRMVLETVRGLAGAGYHVTVAVPEDGPLVAELEATGARVVRQPTPILRKSMMSPSGLLRLAGQTLAAIPGSWRLLRSSRAGTVVVNTITPPLWLVLGRLAPGVRVACHVHEAEQALPRTVRRALYLPLHFAHRVIANSRFSLKVLADSAPSLAGRTVVVHNAVPGPPVVVAAKDEPHQPLRLLYVGRISARKGLVPAVEAISILRDEGVSVSLRIIGSVFPGNEGFAEDLQELVNSRGLGEVVELVGFRSDVWPDLAAADIVLVPSLVDESFGNVAVEAALAARPAVVSALPGLIEATELSGSVRLVPPGDAPAIAAAVVELANRWPDEVGRASAAASPVASAFSAGRYSSELVSALDLPAVHR